MNRNELKKLSKSQLIELLLLKNEKEKSEKSIIIHRPRPAPITKKPVIIPKEKKKPVIIPKEKKKPAPIRKVIPKGPKISTIIQRPVPAPRTKKSKISTIIQRPVPAPRTKKSYILDEPIPEKEIPKGQKILKPSMVKKIKKVVKFGKKQVENWGEWLMKVDVPQIVVDDEIKSFKRNISELYKTELPKQYEIIKIGEKSNKKFKSFFDIFKIEPHQSTEIDFGKVLLEIANRVIYQRVLKNGDKIRWILSHSSWNKPISTKLITISGSISANDLINELVNFVEYKEVPLSEVKIEIQSIKIPRGMGRLHVMNSNLKQKNSVITIKNDDSICLARAIVTAVANINKTQWTKTQLKDGFNKSRKLQKKMAEKLHEEAGVEINEFGSTLEDVKKFANHLQIQINIVDAEYFNELILTTEKPDVNSQMIYLYKNKNHFDVITSMTGFLCKSYYCHSCKKSYKKRDCHKCPDKCIACFKYFQDGNKCSGEEIICQRCNRSFFGQKCFNEHKRNRGKKNYSNIGFDIDPKNEINDDEIDNEIDDEIDSVCRRVKKCLKCERVFTDRHLYKKNKDDNKVHICGYSECSNCRVYCDMHEHKCYMKMKKCMGGNCTGDNGCNGENKKCYSCQTRTDKYMFYDFETNQETGTHVVNWVDCEDFHGNQNTFETIDEFCQFIFNKKYSCFTFIAHNAKGYDAQFIRNWCIENSMKPYCIYNGTKIMFMEVNGRRFIDSLNFITAPLSSFPKTFGLTELKKGYFPHYFNKKHNQNYVGPIPSKRHFGYDQMSSSVRKGFLQWYNAKQDENYVFNFKNELREYCRSDVDILRRSMLKFREDFIELENIDPLQYITIASVCMTIYRCNYMPNKEIAVVKDVTRGETYSKISIVWLDWLSKRDGVNIKHALNGGEKTFPFGKVDGFCEESKTVYEFQGCFWHGCEKCFSNDMINTKNQMDMLTLRKRTQAKNDKIRNAGYKLVEEYECELKENNEFKKFFKTWDRECVEPLNPRDAFFGGRTNVTKLTYDFKECEKGRYVDFVSLYPTVQFFKDYPVGHPDKILFPKSFNPEWFGFVKCKIFPPRNIYHPVLPVKMECGNAQKLLFPLCKTCAVSKNQNKCTHSDDERSFIGTWCTNELNVAIQKGYKIQKIYEVWNFKKRSNNLFKEYVRKFMKIKMESSELKIGEGCTYKSVDEYRSIVKSKLGIELGEIKFNPGMRSIAKLCLNSLWGKFGQRNNMNKTEYVTEPSEFYKILLDEKIDDLNIHFINEDMVEMTYNLKEQFVDNSKDSNIFIAAFTTSHARMMLYEVLDKLGDSVLGFDTDSCWYIEKENGPRIETGDNLGDLTDELGGHHIEKWCGSGPKSYSYCTSNGKIVCKVKGFTLNHENSQYINQQTMRQIIEGHKKQITTVNEQMIFRNSQTKQVENRYQEKDFRLCYDKRIMKKTESGIETFPYGY